MIGESSLASEHSDSGSMFPSAVPPQTYVAGRIDQLVCDVAVAFVWIPLFHRRGRAVVPGTCQTSRHWVGHHAFSTIVLVSSAFGTGMINKLERVSLTNDIAFDMFQDKETAAIIRALMTQKVRLKQFVSCCFDGEHYFIG